MKLTVRCRSGLRIDFEGSLEELERFDGFLAELARLERDRLAPAPHDAIGAAVASPRVIGAQARAAMSAHLAERHGAHHAQALALVAEHGPVSPAWVADQLVKNRRDTIALMRDMAAAGELVETDEGGYYDIPDRDDQEQAVAA